MKLFYAMLLWTSEFELAIARSAPEKNMEHIAALLHDIERLELLAKRLEMNT